MAIQQKLTQQCKSIMFPQNNYLGKTKYDVHLKYRNIHSPNYRDIGICMI